MSSGDAILSGMKKFPCMVPLTAALLLSSPGLASAEETRWYGWQNAIVYGSAGGLALTAGAANRPELGMAALGVYAVGGGVVHGAHGRFGVAALGVGLNVGLPAVGALGGFAISHASSKGGRYDAPIFAGVGAAVGALAAIIIDVAVLAKETVPAPATTGSQVTNTTQSFSGPLLRWGGGF